MHELNREKPCGVCRHGELVRRLETERAPTRPTPRWAAITFEDAAANRRLLADALGVPDDIPPRTTIVTYPTTGGTSENRRPPSAKCRSCKGPSQPGLYVCTRCWEILSNDARLALCRRDTLAVQRHRELNSQIDRGVPLRSIEITP
ncbi:hypothetical protein GCM10023196_037430 [Actinoallomurus vinaceus]|uniref:Uncharacterized protein n=2 Tax=Actinoallomurus vinaceus TaxID=1080074 RepID=A0ABP8U9J7_9ACTN